MGAAISLCCGQNAPSNEADPLLHQKSKSPTQYEQKPSMAEPQAKYLSKDSQFTAASIEKLPSEKQMMKSPTSGNNNNNKSSTSSQQRTFTCCRDIGYASDQNEKYRGSMEDEHVFKDSYGVSGQGYAAVYDGHGGRKCVELIKNKLDANLLKMKEADVGWLDTLKKAYLATDTEVDQILEESKDKSGCTSLSLIISQEEKRLYFANIGDTRAVVIGRDGSVRRVTVDHNAKTNKEDVKRIKDNKGFVFQNKVGGQLSVTRAFGDHHLKECGVIADPYLNQIELDDVAYVILACDGLWDVLTDEEAGEIVKQHTNCDGAAQSLLQEALKKTRDNVTIVVLAF